MWRSVYSPCLPVWLLVVGGRGVERENEEVQEEEGRIVDQLLAGKDW